MSRDTDLVAIFEGPTPFAEALQSELKARDIPSILRGLDVYPGTLYPHSTVPAAFCSVQITANDFENRREAVDECLAFFTPSEAPEEVDYSGQV